MRKFNVTVNGNAYEVEIEEVEAGASAPVAAAAPVAPAAPKAAPAAPKAAPKAAAPAGKAGAVKVTAPMPGNILKVNVEVGQKVSKGDVLCIVSAVSYATYGQCPEGRYRQFRRRSCHS